MFRNEPLTSFSDSQNFDALLHALEALGTEKLYSAPIIGGNEFKTSRTIKSLDPSSPSHVIGDVHLAGIDEASKAIESLKSGQISWAETSPEERANIIRNVGHLLKKDKFRIAALIIREAGKPWREADGDIAEAIDFCLYYADEMERLGTPFSTDLVAGEDNEYFYEPRGISLVVSPWNFPLAIACGMTVASLVTGNTTILKPAEPTCIIAFEFAKILLQAGVPKDAFAFLPGPGREIGNFLVEHNDVDMICFTGSKEVGLGIIKKAGDTRAGQVRVKRVVAEMGGKNAIIVDEDADLDEATKGIIESAFGYAGQKCSACSRLIVVGSLYEKILSRLRDATSDVIIGPASDSSTFLPPVIDKKSHERILGVIAEAEKSQELLVKGPIPRGDGYFVPATIFRDVDRNSSLWKEEVFGPVLACCKADTFEEAVKFANDSEYALTGGVFSRNPRNITFAKKHFKVGNLYINRKCTGALVKRQPFGGGKMSGIGSKAGGQDYLLQFMEPRVITENTLRRGFVPE